jgi:hypothetical protein
MSNREGFLNRTPPDGCFVHLYYRTGLAYELPNAVEITSLIAQNTLASLIYIYIFITNLRQDSWCPSRNLKHVPTECKSKALPLEPTRSCALVRVTY